MVKLDKLSFSEKPDKNMKIDLHTHTFYSDGSLSPKELVNLAVKRKIKILAITDHDTIKGVKKILKTKNRGNIEIIPGIEITAKVSNSKDEIHIIGLYINIYSKSLRSLLYQVSRFKKIKINKRLKLVNKYFKTSITYRDLKEKTRGIPSLPHIAMVLLDRGYVNNIKEGIRLMTKGGPCHVNLVNKLVHAREAIKIIHESNGIAILAHPFAYKRENKFVYLKDIGNLVKELVDYKLGGIELYTPDITKNEKKFCEKIVKKYNLAVSGGSDFHDEKFIPQNKLGFLNIKKDRITILKN